MTSLLATYNKLKILEIAPSLESICRYFTSRTLQSVEKEMAALPAATVDNAFNLRTDHVEVAISASGRHVISSFYRQLDNEPLHHIIGYDITYHGSIPETVNLPREATAYTVVVRNIVIESAGARLIEHKSHVPAKATAQPPAPPPVTSSLTWNVVLQLGPAILQSQILHISTVQWNVVPEWGGPSLTVIGSLSGTHFTGNLKFDNAPADGTILIVPSSTYTLSGLTGLSPPEPQERVARHKGAGSTTAAWLAAYDEQTVVDVRYQGATP